MIHSTHATEDAGQEAVLSRGRGASWRAGDTRKTDASAEDGDRACGCRGAVGEDAGEGAIRTRPQGRAGEVGQSEDEEKWRGCEEA